jgi:hypothetical protein
MVTSPKIYLNLADWTAIVETELFSVEVSCSAGNLQRILAAVLRAYLKTGYRDMNSKDFRPESRF